jgi:hypothetical protein
MALLHMGMSNLFASLIRLIISLTSSEVMLEFVILAASSASTDFHWSPDHLLNPKSTFLAPFKGLRDGNFTESSLSVYTKPLIGPVELIAGIPSTVHKQLK